MELKFPFSVHDFFFFFSWLELVTEAYVLAEDQLAVISLAFWFATCS